MQPGFPDELAHPAESAHGACYVCGQRRLRREPEHEWVCDLPLDPRGPRDRPRRDENGDIVEPLLDQPWRWRHVSCEPSDVGIVRGLLRVEVSEPVARAAVEAAELTIARNANRTGRKPWSHVSTEQREQLRREVDAAIAALLPRRHASGRCVICGRSRSKHWYTSPAVRWADGRGVECELCAEVERAVDSYDDQGRRRAHLCAMAGLVRAIGHDGLTYGFRFACEVLDDAERFEDGCGSWAYRPDAIATVRRVARESEPGSIRDELERAMAVQLARVKRARELEKLAAAEVAEDGAVTVTW